MLVLLSLSGLIPFSNLVKSINVDKKQIKIITERNKVFHVEFNNLMIFDDTKVSGLSSIVKTNKDETKQIKNIKYVSSPIGFTHSNP